MPVLVLSPNGTYTHKQSLSDAMNDADTVNRHIVLTGGAENISTVEVLDGGRTFECKDGGYVTFSGSGALTGLTYAEAWWFGVVGNGIADDTDNLNLAIAATAVTGKLVIPYTTGGYRCDTRVELLTGSHVVVEGKTTLKFYGGVAVRSYCIFDAPNSVIYVDGGDDALKAFDFHPDNNTSTVSYSKVDLKLVYGKGDTSNQSCFAMKKNTYNEINVNGQILDFKYGMYTAYDAVDNNAFVGNNVFNIFNMDSCAYGYHINDDFNFNVVTTYFGNCGMGIYSTYSNCAGIWNVHYDGTSGKIEATTDVDFGIINVPADPGTTFLNIDMSKIRATITYGGGGNGVRQDGLHKTCYGDADAQKRIGWSLGDSIKLTTLPGWYSQLNCVNVDNGTSRFGMAAGGLSLDTLNLTTVLIGDRVGITLDDGTIHWTLASSSFAANSFSIATAIPEGRSVAVGAVVYTTRWALAAPVGGFASLSSSGTPSIDSVASCVTTDTTTITAFTNQRIGQVITIKFAHDKTITSGGNIKLAGAANFVGTANDTLTLMADEALQFVEIARSVN